MTAINVKNITKKYPETIAVNNISFDTPYGKITALLGSNGAGKSTTLNMIEGIHLPTSGEIYFEGKTLKKNYKEIKEQMGYLTCGMALYDSFSIYET